MQPLSELESAHHFSVLSQVERNLQEFHDRKLLKLDAASALSGGSTSAGVGVGGGGAGPSLLASASPSSALSSAAALSSVSGTGGGAMGVGGSGVYQPFGLIVVSVSRPALLHVFPYLSFPSSLLSRASLASLSALSASLSALSVLPNALKARLLKKRPFEHFAGRCELLGLRQVQAVVETQRLVV